MIAVTYLVYQDVHRPPWRKLVKAILLAAAFVFWAANQLWPNSTVATLWNDIAIALFVLDVFLVIVGRQRHRTSPSLKQCPNKEGIPPHAPWATTKDLLWGSSLFVEPANIGVTW
jgi:hypothetical protein